MAPASAVAIRRGVRAVHLGGLRLRLDTRVLSLVGLVSVGVLTLAAWGMTLGTFAVPLDEVVKSILGQGQKEFDFIILTLRLPRVLSAVMIGRRSLSRRPRRVQRKNRR